MRTAVSERGDVNWSASSRGPVVGPVRGQDPAARGVNLPRRRADTAGDGREEGQTHDGAMRIRAWVGALQVQVEQRSMSSD